MAEKKKPYDYWNHGINPITGWPKSSPRPKRTEIEVFKIPKINKNNFTN